MKKISAVLLLMTIFLNTLSGCGSFSHDQIISNAIEIDISSGKEISKTDSHGGFHNDGCEYTLIQFPDDSILDEIKKNEHWHSLPMSVQSAALIYGIPEADIAPYLTNEQGEPMIPEVKNGYYYFRDRHSESDDCYDDSNVLERYSFNFTFAVYDTDTNLLHYLIFDT